MRGAGHRCGACIGEFEAGRTNRCNAHKVEHVCQCQVIASQAFIFNHSAAAVAHQQFAAVERNRVGVQVLDAGGVIQLQNGTCRVAKRSGTSSCRGIERSRIHSKRPRTILRSSRQLKGTQVDSQSSVGGSNGHPGNVNQVGADLGQGKATRDLARECDVAALCDCTEAVHVAAADTGGGTESDGTGIAGGAGACVDQSTERADIRAGGDGLHAGDGPRAAVACTADGEGVGVGDRLAVEVEDRTAADSKSIGRSTKGRRIAKLQGAQSDGGIEGRSAVAVSKSQGVRTCLGQGIGGSSGDGRAQIQCEVAIAADGGVGAECQCTGVAGCRGAAVPHGPAGSSGEDGRGRG